MLCFAEDCEVVDFSTVFGVLGFIQLSVQLVYNLDFSFFLRKKKRFGLCLD